MVMRSNKKTQSDISLNDFIGVDKEGNQISLIDVVGNDDDEIFDEIDLKIMSKKMYDSISSELDDREKEIILLRYGLLGGASKTQWEIAKILGISRSYV